MLTNRISLNYLNILNKSVTSQNKKRFDFFHYISGANSKISDMNSGIVRGKYYFLQFELHRISIS